MMNNTNMVLNIFTATISHFDTDYQALSGSSEVQVSSWESAQDIASKMSGNGSYSIVSSVLHNNLRKSAKSIKDANKLVTMVCPKNTELSCKIVPKDATTFKVESWGTYFYKDIDGIQFSINERGNWGKVAGTVYEENNTKVIIW